MSQNIILYGGAKYTDLLDDGNLNLLMSLVEKIRTIYSEKRKNTSSCNGIISDTLVSKVLLGTLGCIPAYVPTTLSEIWGNKKSFRQQYNSLKISINTIRN